MKRLMVVFVAVVTVVQVACADLMRWDGSSGAVNWSDGASWANLTTGTTGEVPGSSDTVVFLSSGTKAETKVNFNVTPPADFAGRILSSNGTHRAYLTLTPPETPLFTLGGQGTVVGTTAVAALVEDGSSLMLDVQPDTAMMLPSGLPASAMIGGCGTVKLSTAAQLAQVTVFDGTIDCTGLTDLTIEDIALLSGRKVLLPEGFTFAAGAGAAKKPFALKGWAENASGWSLNGGLYAAISRSDIDTSLVNQNGPFVNDAGELVLIDDVAQGHAAVLSDVAFKSSDIWGVSFRWTPDKNGGMAANAQGLSSKFAGRNFGVVLQKDATSFPGSQAGLPAGSYGFWLYNYRTDASRCVKFATDDSSMSVGSGALWLMSDLGIDFTTAIDFVIRCDAGVMTVTMKQGAKTRSFRKSVAGALSGTGAYLTIFATACNESGASSATRMRLSNFRGWCMRGDCWTDGNWTKMSSDYQPISSSTWNLRQGCGTAKDSTTWLDGVDCQTADGSTMTDNGKFALQREVAYNNAIAICKTAYHPKKPVKLSWKLDFGTRNNTYGGAMEFGFVSSATSYQSKPTWWNTGAKYYATTALPGCFLGLYCDYRNRIGLLDNGNIPDQGKYSKDENGNEVYDSRPYFGRNSGTEYGDGETMSFEVLYDGAGTMRAKASITSDTKSFDKSYKSAVFLTGGSCAAKMYFCMLAGTNSARDYYRATTAYDFEAYHLGDDAMVPAELDFSSVAAPALTCGSTSFGTDPGRTTFEAVTLGTNAALTVRPETDAAAAEVATLTVRGATKVTVAEGASLKVGRIVFAHETSSAVAFSGAVAFGSTLTITVLDDYLKSIRTEARLVDLAAATVSGPLPTTVTLVDSTGAAIPMRGRTLSVDADGITLSGPGGLVIVVK